MGNLKKYKDTKTLKMVFVCPNCGYKKAVDYERKGLIIKRYRCVDKKWNSKCPKCDAYMGRPYN